MTLPSPTSKSPGRTWAGRAYVIGAPKCGAQTLASWLEQHPDVILPRHTPQHVHASDLAIAEGNPPENIPQSGPTSPTLQVEYSDWYLYSEAAVPSILARDPEARFILALRNPADVAWALHASNLAEGIEHVADFGTAWAMSHARLLGRGVKLDTDARLLSYKSVCALGFQVSRLLAQVPFEHVHMVFLEDLCRAPEETLANLHGFLGLPSAPLEKTGIEEFVIERPLGILHRAVRRGQIWQRQAFPNRPIGVLNRLNALNARPGTILEMPRYFHQKVCDSLADDIGILAALTGRDLSHWIS